MTMRWTTAGACALVLAACAAKVDSTKTATAVLVLDKIPDWNGCVAAVRGALEQVPGFKDLDISTKSAEIVVRYDPDATNVDKVLAGLAAGGRPAKKK